GIGGGGLGDGFDSGAVGSGAGGAGTGPGGVGTGAGVVSPSDAGRAGAFSGGDPGTRGSRLGGAGSAGGAGAPMQGDEEEERERSTWLTEDQDVWGGDIDVPPPVIGGEGGRPAKAALRPRGPRRGAPARPPA